MKLNQFHKTALVWTGVAAAVLVAVLVTSTTARAELRETGRVPDESVINAAAEMLRQGVVPALDRTAKAATGRTKERVLAADLAATSKLVVGVLSLDGQQLVTTGRSGAQVSRDLLATATKRPEGAMAKELNGAGAALTLVVRVPTANPRVLVVLATPVAGVSRPTNSADLASALPLSMVVGLAVLVVGAAAATVFTRRLGDGPSPASQDRQVLVDACVTLRDLVTSDALIERIDASLGRVGVEAVVADGSRFEPDKHHAVDKVATSDSDRHNTVATTERVGFVDRGRVLRVPDVIVYQKT